MKDLPFLVKLQVFGILYVISVGLMYYLSKRAGGPLVLPGDFYRTRQGRKTYIPTGGALIMTFILYYLLGVVATKFGR